MVKILKTQKLRKLFVCLFEWKNRTKVRLNFQVENEIREKCRDVENQIFQRQFSQSQSQDIRKYCEQMRSENIILKVL